VNVIKQLLTVLTLGKATQKRKAFTVQIGMEIVTKLGFQSKPDYPRMCSRGFLASVTLTLTLTR